MQFKSRLEVTTKNQTSGMGFTKSQFNYDKDVEFSCQSAI